MNECGGKSISEKAEAGKGEQLFPVPFFLVVPLSESSFFGG